jgi:threonine dehydratase
MRQPARDGVINALENLRKIVMPTPVFQFGFGKENPWVKAESLQPIGAFKLRGAWHRLSDLNDEERARGVVAFSSGNHAQGVAWAARRLGMAATIVMPADAPTAKLAATRALGAEVILYDRASESREAIAGRLADDRGATLVPSFDDPWVIEGQGSAGLEALAQLPAPPECVVIPCGGGGLSAGIALALPDAEIIVVEPEGWDDMGRSLALGEIVPVDTPAPPTSCDALQTFRVAEMTFDLLKARGAHGVWVNEAEIGAAMAHAFAHLRLVIEPGGAVALAAVLAGKVPVNDRTLIILSGGNVDPATFTRMIGA